MISVIITVYNDWIYLERSLRSVLEQTILPYEIIVVDDGSSFDGISKICNKLSDDYSFYEILYHRKENGGASSARNYGLRVARGDTIAFLDVDDEMLANNLEWRSAELQKTNSKCFGIYGASLNTKSGSYEKKHAHLTECSGDYNVRLMGRRGGMPAGSPYYLYRKYVLDEVLGFDEQLQVNEDFDLILRILKKGYIAYGFDRPCFIRNERNDSLSKINVKKVIKSSMAFLKKSEKNHSLPLDEINTRKKQLYVSCSIRGFLRKDIGFFDAIIFLNKGFEYGKPDNLKEYFCYIFSFLMRKNRN